MRNLIVYGFNMIYGHTPIPISINNDGNPISCSTMYLVKFSFDEKDSSSSGGVFTKSKSSSILDAITHRIFCTIIP